MFDDYVCPAMQMIPLNKKKSLISDNNSLTEVPLVLGS